jgi:adenosylcobyric acid synthase
VKEYYSLKQELIPIIEESLEKLRSKYDLILIEGAGSPAEINLKSHDIVNMWVAKLAGSYVLLVADIERGGVFASILGTLHLLDELERSLIKGIIVNKFRGDVEILTPGYEYIHRTTGVPIIGTIPYIEDLTIEEEDSLALSSKKSRLNNLNKININIIQLPRISNFTDFIPLEKDERVNLTYIRKDLEDPDLIIIPGTKNIISDLNFLKEKGLDKQIREKFHQGSLIIGICEGFQILGKKIMNPNKIENEVTYVEGIGLLDVDTQLCREKITQQTFAETANNGLFFKKGLKLKGYEIHMGRTVSNRERPFLKFKKEEGFVEDGSISPCGKIIGTYLHGLFDNVQFCNNLLNYLWKKKFKKSPSLYQKIKSKEAEYDRLASVLESAIDMKFILDLIKI